MTHFRAALFDLDGVLVDTEGLYTQFWSDIDRRYPTGIDDFAAAIKGTTLTEIMQSFPEASRQGIVDELYAFEKNMPYAFFPGAEAWLEAVKGAGLPIAIVTSSDDAKMANVLQRLPQLSRLADVIVNGSQVRRSKPHPEGYLTAAERLGVPAEQCVVFEDSLQGLRAGRAAGARVVALDTTNPREAVAPLADMVISTFGDTTLAAVFGI